MVHGELDDYSCFPRGFWNKSPKNWSWLGRLIQNPFQHCHLSPFILRRFMASYLVSKLHTSSPVLCFCWRSLKVKTCNHQSFIIYSYRTARKPVKVQFARVPTKKNTSLANISQNHYMGEWLKGKTQTYTNYISHLLSPLSKCLPSA